MIVLEKLQSEEIEQLLRRALERLGAEVKCDSEDGSSNQPDNSRYNPFCSSFQISFLVGQLACK